MTWHSSYLDTLFPVPALTDTSFLALLSEDAKNGVSPFRHAQASEMTSVIPVTYEPGADKATERRLLAHYTNALYRTYNRLLKYGTMPQDDEEWAWQEADPISRTRATAQAKAEGGIQQLLKAVQRGRVARGLVLYRAAADKEIAAVQVGQTVTLPSFISTTINVDRAAYFGFQQHGSFTSRRLWRLLVPVGATARWVDPYSANKGEAEVVLPPGTTFTVVSIDRIKIPLTGKALEDALAQGMDELDAFRWAPPIAAAKMGDAEWRWVTSSLMNSDFYDGGFETLVTAKVTTPKVAPR